jgi:hypothetical protein
VSVISTRVFDGKKIPLQFSHYPRASPGNGFASQDNDFITGRSESATKNSADLARAARNYYFHRRQLAFAHVALCKP